ncbi:MAG: MBL fold metallo-hydrolase [Syntrophomonadaceae bacterium]|jgi:glyoxylase-like metal-dependent hydrolase (beta-lactamase superfamily II)|nr:MBL fold metallo-hydrolase [Syntrophomonadaceae bacterium]
MELKKINGNTYYIPGPTNIGLFQFKDKYSLLVDTGSDNSEARKISNMLNSLGISIKYVLNSHEHSDHWGGNLYIKDNYPGSVFYTSSEAALFIENPYLFPLYIYGGQPLQELSRDYVRSKQMRLDYLLEAGIEKINGEKFDIIALPGHARGQIGVATRDNVCFIGDALFSPEIIQKYSVPFIMDIASQLNTYELISSLHYDYYVLGHADQIYKGEEMPALIELNRRTLNAYLDLCLNLVDQPKSREDLLEEIIILEDLSVDLNEYYLLSSTLASLLSYLHHRGALKYQIENGRVYFYK